MGQSTDAILVYGIPLEETIDHWNEDEDEGGGEKSGPSWLAWSGETEEGVCVVSHCSSECPMHILAIAGTERRAWRGHPQLVSLTDLHPPPEWEAALASYIKKHKLKRLPGSKIGWWLCSNWSG